MTILTRRRLMGSIGLGAGSLMLGGCDRIVASPAVRGTLGVGEKLTMGAQRLLTDRSALAREFTAAEMSPVFRTNGNTMPASDSYRSHLAEGFGQLAAGGGRARRPPAIPVAGADQGDALAHPDHSP